MPKNKKLNPDLHNQDSLSKKMQEMLASLELEGIQLSEEAMVDVKLFDAGEITKDEFIKRALERVKNKMD